MSLENFIPSIWAGAVLRNLHKNLIYAQPGIINRNYEGDIKDKGDSVKINNIGPVTVFNYTKNTDLTAAQALADDQQTLTIDQAKAFNFQVDDIDKAQQTPKVMDEGTYEAGYALSNAADQFVAGLYPNTDAANLVGTDGAPITIPYVYTVGTASAYEHLVKLKIALDKANVPVVDRFVVVSPDFGGVIALDPRFVSFGTPQNRMALQSGQVAGEPSGMNGQIGQVAGFNVLQSNNVPVVGGNQKIIAGHSMAWTFADQINKTEAYRPPLRFADALKGLHLYGAKVIRTNCLAVGTVNFS